MCSHVELLVISSKSSTTFLTTIICSCELRCNSVKSPSFQTPIAFHSAGAVVRQTPFQSFLNLSDMPRRPPPSALRLSTGAKPPRNTPKHTMPSLPQPVFQPSAFPNKGPAPRSRDSFRLELGLETVLDADPFTPQSRGTPQMVRGPWDHSGCIAVGFDVGTVLRPLKPVAVGQ
ncbi:hypothetical protein BDN72DRAFT_69953 [Pluteus cervinus]|uniref:Uncharacterized protein n=1 Tax=Pluteus cervinus TaxID=181527 RepID=A0ACD3AQD8_9AGAR|nr:hypothetical protein BDN72DRAFT_69953 [Pluteus cervinus]